MAALQIIFKNKIKKLQPLSLGLNYSSFTKIMEYKRCCKILGISEDSDQEEIRKAYLKLVKRYHPDSGTEEADAYKFSEIDKAFKILMNKKSKERWGIDEDKVQEQDIKLIEERQHALPLRIENLHTAPQHRQYLSYEGVGIGTPFQRQKQYTKIRAVRAAENVLQHRIAKVSADEGALLVKNPLKHKIKTKYGFDRLVEDLIQESMSRGEFNKLSGVGKPLPTHQNRNPYVDFVTHKLNEVLIDNGFTPEWITLQKEIREEIKQLRDALLSERSYLGPYPLNGEENNDWNETVNKYQQMAEVINKKITKFNLVVPIMDKQMIHIDLEKESQKVLLNGEHSIGFKKQTKKAPPDNNNTTEENLFDFIEHLFKK